MTLQPERRSSDKPKLETHIANKERVYSWVRVGIVLIGIFLLLLQNYMGSRTILGRLGAAPSPIRYISLRTDKSVYKRNSIIRYKAVKYAEGSGYLVMSGTHLIDVDTGDIYQDIYTTRPINKEGRQVVYGLFVLPPETPPGHYQLYRWAIPYTNYKSDYVAVYSNVFEVTR